MRIFLAISDQADKSDEATDRLINFSIEEMRPRTEMSGNFFT